MQLRKTIILLVCLSLAAATVVSTALAATSASPSATEPYALATTGGVSAVGVHSATLEGSIAPSGAPPIGSTARVYFQIGPKLPYELQTVDQDPPANQPLHIHASLIGLQSNTLYHYRLVAFDNSFRMSVGADHTFTTAPEGRLRPSVVRVSVTPRFHFLLPDVVKVSGEVLPPPSLSAAQACKGFVDIAFRVHTVAVQLLRAGIHRDCSFSRSVRFSDRRRLHGGRVIVRVLFPGNRYLQRLAATPQEIQVG